MGDRRKVKRVKLCGSIGHPGDRCEEKTLEESLTDNEKGAKNFMQSEASRNHEKRKYREDGKTDRWDHRKKISHEGNAAPLKKAGEEEKVGELCKGEREKRELSGLIEKRRGTFSERKDIVEIGGQRSKKATD